MGLIVIGSYATSAWPRKSHTAENIGQKIEEILDEWNIDKDIIVAAVTDNARNMINDINGMGFHHFPCMGSYFTTRNTKSI